MFAGDDATIQYIHNKSDRSGVQDITGYTNFVLLIKAQAELPDSRASLVVVGVVADASLGLVTFTLHSSDTLLLRGTFVFVVRYVNNLGEHKTGATGTFAGTILVIMPDFFYYDCPTEPNPYTCDACSHPLAPHAIIFWERGSGMISRHDDERPLIVLLCDIECYQRFIELMRGTY